MRAEIPAVPSPIYLGEGCRLTAHLQLPISYLPRLRRSVPSSSYARILGCTVLYGSGAIALTTPYFEQYRPEVGPTSPEPVVALVASLMAPCTAWRACRG